MAPALELPAAGGLTGPEAGRCSERSGLESGPSAGSAVPVD